jgi:hypothetical protein
MASGSFAAPSGAELWFSLADIAREKGVDAAIEKYNAFSEPEKESIKAALDALLIKIEEQNGSPGDFAPQSGSQCYGWYTVRVYAYNPDFNRTLWELFQQIYVCYNSMNRVSSAWCSSWVGRTDYLIEWRGYSSYCTVTYGGLGYATIKYFSQGTFCASIGYCIRSWHPWIAQQHDYRPAYFYWTGA